MKRIRMQKFKVFISSVQKEFAKERELLFRHFITDALLSSFFEPVLFENRAKHKTAKNRTRILSHKSQIGRVDVSGWLY